MEHAAPIAADPPSVDRNCEVKTAAGPGTTDGPEFLPPSSSNKGRKNPVSIVSDRRVDSLTELFVAGLNGVKPVSAPRTIGDLLNTLVPALDADCWEIEDGSVSVTGLTIVVAGTLWRVRFDPESMVYPTQDAYQSDRSGAFLGHDAAGFNGQELVIEF
jgi:hypothetical protein